MEVNRQVLRSVERASFGTTASTLGFERSLSDAVRHDQQTSEAFSRKIGEIFPHFDSSEWKLECIEFHDSKPSAGRGNEKLRWVKYGAHDGQS